jgi:hypothetical protein
MKRNCIHLCVYLLLMCCALPLLAQSAASADSVVPGMVKFTGALNDANGKPLTGTVGVTFLLYTEQSGGTPLWMETQNVQADKAGHYSVMLGSATSHGIPAKAFAAGEARWLAVQPSGQNELPRVMLASVPYSLKALDAETLGGRPASSFMTAPAAGAKNGSAAQPADQPNEIVCASGSACKAGFIPLFATHGGSAKVKDSIITQSGTTVTVIGTENVSGDITSNGSVNADNVNANNIFANDSVSTTGSVAANSISGTTFTIGDDVSAIVGTAGAAGNAGATFGVAGDSASDSGRGIMGIATGESGVGVWGEGFTTGSEEDGVAGIANGPGVGVAAFNEADGDALFADANTGFAGVFVGDVDVFGNLAKSGGSFKIDHPLDPANKYLYHSFVESPDMMNIYNGVADLDGKGEAVVKMPDWFETLNKDFRYQLTSIGAPGPDLYIAEEISGNQFKIAGGKAGARVSWQVTGVRHDAWANAHRIPVEQMKTGRESGLYIHPELFGAPPEKSIARAHHPALKPSRGRLLPHTATK